MDIYQSAIRPLLFNLLKTDPEFLHQQTIRSLTWWEKNHQHPPTNWLHKQLQNSFCFANPRLQQQLWGLHFPNPLGLAAGFDKDAAATNIWSSLGFGFAEMGTVTFHSQPGNPRPRLFRLPADSAALNRMGFNNNGAQTMANQLIAQRQKKYTPVIPIGINLGKSKITPLTEAATDYLQSFRLLQELGDYFVVNVSSPNTPGLRSLQDATMLSSILSALQSANNTHKPIFVKIAPDLEWEAIADIIELAKTYQLAGIIATNTTIRRDGLQTAIIEATGNPPSTEPGGISGTPVRDRSTEIIRFIWQRTQGEIPIIGVGGIFSADDAWEKIIAGASIVQIYTGWIYQGPWMVRRILAGLVTKLDQNGLKSISDAVGYSS